MFFAVYISFLILVLNRFIFTSYRTKHKEQCVMKLICVGKEERVCKIANHS